jgi:sulfatase maturation enzyme AslB (radical SAM superfamily)
MINEITIDKRVYTSVSFDFEARESYDLVLKNMALLNKPFSILMLASPKLLTQNVDEMISVLNTFTNLESVEIKPYSSNQANQHSVTHKEYEEFVKRWISSPIEKRFEFVNEYYIQDVLDEQRNAFSDDHVYITPTGKFAVLEFDLNDNEFFLELDTWQDYIKWTNKEKSSNVSDICRSCEFYGKCLTEHYRYVRNLDNSCNGYKFLIEWYRGRVEN